MRGVGHQGFLFQEEGEHEAQDEHRHEIEEDPRHGVRIRGDIAVAQRGGQGVHQLRGDRLGVGQPRRLRQPVAELAGQPVGEEGAEDGRTDAAADLPEVVGGAGRGAEVGGAYGVLHGEHQHRHHEADAEAEDAHPEAVDLARGVLLHPGQQPHPHRRQRAAHDGEHLVVPGAADELSGDDGGEDDAAHHRQHQQPGLGGRGAVDHLQEGRQIAGGAEERDADDGADQAGDIEDRVAEQPQRDQRFGGEVLDGEEQQGTAERTGAEAEDDPRVPGVLGAAPTGQQDQAGGERGEQQRARDVQPGTARRPGQLQYEGDDQERERAERDVEVEAPAPGGAIGAEAADQRAGHGGEAEGGTDQAHVAAAGPWRYDIGDDRLDPDDEPAAADALDGPEDDQFVHRPRPAGQRRADGEDEDGEEEDGLTAEEVAELAVEGQPDGGGEEVGRHRPGHPAQAVQLADDLRECGGDDGLVEGREQQRQHQTEEDHADAAGAERHRRTGDGSPGAVVRCRSRCRAGRGRTGYGRTGPLDPLAQGGPAHVLLPSSRLLPPNFSHWATTPINRGERVRAG